MTNQRTLRIAAAIVIGAASIAGCGSLTGAESAAPPDERHAGPREAVESFWQAALAGDAERIKAMVAPVNDLLLHECPRPKMAANAYGEAANSAEAPTSGLADAVSDGGSVRTFAAAVKANRKSLRDGFRLAESTAFKNEARLTYEPSASPNPYNTFVVFLLNQEGQWKIIDIRYKADMRFLGNKKYGEERNCEQVATN